MTVLQMHERVRRGLLENNTPEYEMISDLMIDDALNDSQKKYILNILKEDEEIKLRGLEQTPENYFVIQKITKTISFKTKDIKRNEDYAIIDIPENFWIYLSGKVSASISRLYIDKKFDLKANSELFSQSREDLIGKNPFVSNIETSVKAFMENNKIRYKIGKKAILKEISLTYICKPNKISLFLYNKNKEQGNCELPEVTHDIIVNEAIADLLEQVQSRRFSTKQIENNKF